MRGRAEGRRPASRRLGALVAGWAVLSAAVLSAAGLAAAGLAAASQEVPAPESAVPIEHYEVYFELRAEIRSRRLDADVEASARLEMMSIREADGTRLLSLVRALAPATKFYRIDPAGPMGSESKLAAVVTLPEGSWNALEEARRQVARTGTETHRRWSDRTRSKQTFDGTFAFVVIGPEHSRYRVEVAPDGRVLDTENGLTDRWLSGPFDRFVGTWGRDTSTPGPVGYWFWNNGESEPFEYEPHVYHALSRSLDLLRQPMPEAGETTPWPTLDDELLRVLTTLFPKVEGRMAPELEPIRLALEHTRSTASMDTDGARIALRRDAESSELEADWRDDGFELYLRVGYRPVTPSPSPSAP